MLRRLAAPLIAVSVAAAACGGPEIEGTYACPDGTTIEIRADGSFTATEDGETLEGTYEVVGDDVVSFTVQGLNTSDAQIRDGELLLQGTEEPCVRR